MSALKITRGNTLELPLSAVTEVITFLATRGAGKSFAAADIAEELYANHLQFVVVDPMGVYWGLRSSRDGSKAGLAVTILGGERGDVPLEPTSGRLIADVVVDTGQSFVLDLSLFDSKADQVRFMEAFCERIFYRKGPIDQRTPLMLIVDEADEFAPQKPEKNETKMLSHMIRLAKRGRTRGIGLMPLTQRSAEFHKGILDLSSAVVFMRTAGPRDRAAIKKWLAGSAPELIDLVDARFPKLETGHGLIYSPHWLHLDEPVELSFRMIRTFDSYKTPKPGQARPAPARTAEIDLDALGEQIKATVERAKDNDPTELRKRVRELERQLATANTPRARDEAFAQIKADLEQQLAAAHRELEERPPEQIEVPVVSDEDIARLVSGWEALRPMLVDQARELTETLERTLKDPALVMIAEALTGRRQQQTETVERKEAAATSRRVAGAERPAESRQEPPARPPSPPAAASNGHGDLARISGPQQKLLDALAWFEAVGVDAPRKAPLAAVAGVSSKSSGFRANVTKLRSLDLVTYQTAGRVTLTSAGRETAQPPAYIGSAADLQEMVYQMVSGPQAVLLRELVSVYPDALDRETLAERAGVSAASSGFRANVTKLVSFEVAEYPEQGLVRAAPLLFLDDAVTA